MRAEAAARAVGDRDDLALRDVRAGADREARQMGVAGRQCGGVLDAQEVPVAARRALGLLEGDDAGARGADRGPARDPDVDARVAGLPGAALTERGGDRAVDRPD